MKITYRQRLAIYSFCVFTLFTIILVILFLNNAEKIKKETIFAYQKTYVDLIKNYILIKNLDKQDINKLTNLDILFPSKIRVSILDNQGFIIYDNEIPLSKLVESRKTNVEIRRAMITGQGTHTWTNNFNDKTYMGYAEVYGDYIIRIAYLVDNEMLAFFQPNYLSLGIIVILYILTSLIIFAFYNQYVNAIKKLKNVIESFYKNKIPPVQSSTDDELGDIQNLIIKLNNKIEKNKVTILINVNKNVHIQGNRTLLTSIFRNLINNALKYAGENINIDINNYMQDENFYYFSVSDNAKGIEEQYLPRIFERFYRITEGRTRDKGGSGLGLAIVKDAVEFHHGEIQAKNKSGGGLEFLFTLRSY